MSITLEPARVKAFKKSLTINGQTIFPVQKPEELAEKLQELIRDIQKEAYARGRRDQQAVFRRVLGL